jgi:hypothetical protein
MPSWEDPTAPPSSHRLRTLPGLQSQPSLPPGFMASQRCPHLLACHRMHADHAVKAFAVNLALCGMS